MDTVRTGFFTRWALRPDIFPQRSTTWSCVQLKPIKNGETLVLNYDTVIFLGVTILSPPQRLLLVNTSERKKRWISLFPASAHFFPSVTVRRPLRRRESDYVVCGLFVRLSTIFWTVAQTTFGLSAQRELNRVHYLSAVLHFTDCKGELSCGGKWSGNNRSWWSISAGLCKC